MDQSPSLCHRCGLELVPGQGDFYVVNIEAFADPTPASVSKQKLARTDLKAEMERLMAQMRQQSQRELMDQVYRRLTIFLCRSCYTQWIEDPAP